MTDPTARVFHLKLTKAARCGIPFDQLYLVHYSRREQFKNVFPSYLRTRLNPKIWERILPRGIDYLSAEVNGRHEKTPQSPVRTVQELLPDDVLASLHTEWDVVVPTTLGVSRGKSDKPKTTQLSTNPTSPNHTAELRYLAAFGWRKSRASSNLPTIQNRLNPDISALVVYREEIRPVCMACPQITDMLQGKCFLGDDICLRQIGLIGRPTYLLRCQEFEDGVPSPLSEEGESGDLRQ